MNRHSILLLFSLVLLPFCFLYYFSSYFCLRYCCPVVIIVIYLLLLLFTHLFTYSFIHICYIIYLFILWSWLVKVQSLKSSPHTRFTTVYICLYIIYCIPLKFVKWNMWILWKNICCSLFIVHCSLSVCFYGTNFPYERGWYFISHSIFKTYAQRRKDHLGLFLTTNHVVKEGKLLIKLIVVDSNHFIRYKCKITHSRLSNIIWAYINDCSWW